MKCPRSYSEALKVFAPVKGFSVVCSSYSNDYQGRGYALLLKEGRHFVTEFSYGSCGMCDFLQGFMDEVRQSWEDESDLTQEQEQEFASYLFHNPQPLSDFLKEEPYCFDEDYKEFKGELEKLGLWQEPEPEPFEPTSPEPLTHKLQLPFYV